MSDRTPDVVIVGGGIGGLAAALALSREGAQVDLVEQAFEFGEIGAGIQLAPNAQRILDHLGVAAVTRHEAVRARYGVIMDAQDGRVLTRLDFGDPFIRRFHYPYMVMHRSDLLDALLEACHASDRVTLVNDFRAIEVREEGELATVESASGDERSAPVVVGADGLWSTVRKYTVGDGEPICVGDVAYRGAAPIEQVSAQAGEDNVVWWIGRDMHLIQYPIRRGELFNQVAVFSSRQFREGASAWGGEDELEHYFAAKSEYVNEGLKLIGRERNWRLHHRLPVNNWSRGRVTLLGDAAHPMLQYMAQGACQAFEDAVVFARAFAAYGGEPDKVFDRYQQLRLHRTAKVQTWSMRMGEIVHLGGVSAIVRDELFRNRADDDYRYIDWVYSYDAVDAAI